MSTEPRCQCEFCASLTTDETIASDINHAIMGRHALEAEAKVLAGFEIAAFLPEAQRDAFVDQVRLAIGVMDRIKSEWDAIHGSGPRDGGHKVVH